MSSKLLCPNCSLSSRLGVFVKEQVFPSIVNFRHAIILTQLILKQSKSVHTISRQGYISTSKNNSQPPLRRSESRLGSHRNFSATPTASAGILKSLASRQGGAAETYVSYGFTQKLYEACSSQADYEIPQLAQKGVEVPKTADGEELGVGEGWWYKGKLVAILSISEVLLIENSK